MSEVNEPNKLFFVEGSNNQPNHRLQTNKIVIMSEIIDKFILISFLLADSLPDDADCEKFIYISN